MLAILTQRVNAAADEVSPDDAHALNITEVEFVLTRGMKASAILRDVIETVRSEETEDEARAALRAVAALTDSVTILSVRADDLVTLTLADEVEDLDAGGAG